MERNRAMDVSILFRIGASVHTKPVIAYDMTITGKNRRNGLFYN